MNLRRSILAIHFSRFTDGLGSGVLLLTIPLYVVELPHTTLPFSDPIVIGIAVALYSLVSSTLQPLVGALSDRSRMRKPFIQGGFAIMGATCLAFTLTYRAEDVLLLRTIQGIGLGLVIPPARALIINLSELRSRGQSMGISRSMRMLGLAIGPVVASILQIRYGYTVVFYLAAAIMLLGMIPLQMWVREWPQKPALLTENESAKKGEGEPILTIATVGLLMAILLVGSSFSLVLSLKDAFNARLQMSVVGFSGAFSIFTFSRLLFEIPMGRISDGIGKKTLILFGLSILAPSTLLLGLVQTTGQLMFLRLLQGIAAAAIAGPALVLAADLSQGGGEAKQMGIIGMGFGLGIAVGPLLAGVLVSANFQVPFIVSSLITIGAIWVIYQFVPKEAIPVTG